VGSLDLADPSQPILKFVLNLEAKSSAHGPSQSVKG
jgi:hypothetical protein